MHPAGQLCHCGTQIVDTIASAYTWAAWYGRSTMSVRRLPSDNRVGLHDMCSVTRGDYDEIHLENKGHALAVTVDVRMPALRPWKDATERKCVCQDELVDMLDKAHGPTRGLDTTDAVLVAFDDLLDPCIPGMKLDPQVFVLAAKLRHAHQVVLCLGCTGHVCEGGMDQEVYTDAFPYLHREHFQVPGGVGHGGTRLAALASHHVRMGILALSGKYNCLVELFLGLI